MLPDGARRWECPGDDHLRGRVGGLALGVARRHRVAGRREERVRLVDPLVDDRDLDVLAGIGQARPPQRRRADLLRAAVELRAIADARVDAVDARERCRAGRAASGGGRRPSRSRPAGSASGSGRRERACDLRFQGVLSRRDRARVQATTRRERARARQRRLREADDDLDQLTARRRRFRACRSGRERDKSEQAEHETPSHADHAR